MAKYRDDGMSKADQITSLEQSGITGSELRLSKHAADQVFMYPKLSPQEEGNAAYKRCLEILL
jgi:hypothetical protein